MSKVSESRAKWAVATTYVFVSLGFVIRYLGVRLHGGWAWTVWILGLPFSVYLLRFGTDSLWNFLVGRERRRKHILSKTWIEGTWLVQTLDHSSGSPTEIQTGLAEFIYKMPDLDLSCHVTSVRQPSHVPVETTVTCIILADDLHYLHSFERKINTINDIGAAYGAFYCDKAGTPQLYSGHVVIFNVDEGRARQQIARKLSDEEIHRAQARFGKDETWRLRALQDREWIEELRQPVGVLAGPVTNPATADLVR